LVAVTAAVALASVGAVAALGLPARQTPPPALAAAVGEPSAPEVGPTPRTAAAEEAGAPEVDPTHRAAAAEEATADAEPIDPAPVQQGKARADRTPAPTLKPSATRSGVGAEVALTAPQPGAQGREVAEPAERSGSAAAGPSSSGWVCDDGVRLADPSGRRWTVERISFRAMGGYERIVLHLDQDGSASSAATALGASIASSSTQGSSRSRARAAVRRGVGIELSGGIRAGLELRGYRPQGLRAIRDVSIQRDGPASRVFISVSSDGCFRMRAPAWQRGRSAGAAAELIVDVRR
jgi:hypothetical protein